MNLRDKYLNIKSHNLGHAEIQEWGTVHLRDLTLSEMDRLEKSIAENPADALALAVILGVADEQGNRVFSDADLWKIKNTAFNIVKATAEAVVAHNKLNGVVVEAEKKD